MYNKNFSYAEAMPDSLFEPSYKGDESYEHEIILSSSNVPANDFEKKLPNDPTIEKAYNFLK